MTLHNSGRENLHQFLPILSWRHALYGSIMTLWLFSNISKLWDHWSIEFSGVNVILAHTNSHNIIWEQFKLSRQLFNFLHFLFRQLFLFSTTWKTVMLINMKVYFTWLALHHIFFSSSHPYIRLKPNGLRKTTRAIILSVLKLWVMFFYFLSRFELSNSFSHRNVSNAAYLNCPFCNSPNCLLCNSATLSFCAKEIKFA